MSFLRFALCLVLFGSSLAFAQTAGSEPSSEPPVSAPPLVPAPSSPPPLVPAPEQPEEPTSAQPEQSVPEGELIPRRAAVSPSPLSPPFAPGRVVLESLGGVLGGLGLGIGSALAIGGLFSVSGDCAGDDGCALVAAILALPAIAIGIPLGVTITGGLMGGKGRFLPSLGGMAAGIGLSVLLASSGNEAVTGLGFVILPIAGAVVGYELSHPDVPSMPLDSEGSNEGYGSESSSTRFQVIGWHLSENRKCREKRKKSKRSLGLGE